MNSLTQRKRRYNSGSNNERSLQTYQPERYSAGLVRRRGRIISIPGKLKTSAGENAATVRNHSNKLTKLLLNVNIERSLGPVQVVMSPENKVSDLIKLALEIYVKEKRRPLLKETDPKSFELHYSQFSLESLKVDEKLINLGSRNFFCVQSLQYLGIHVAPKKQICLSTLSFHSRSSWISCCNVYVYME